MDDFDRLTYCAEWRPLLAKLCSYSHSEVSSWPSVKLYDKSQGKVCVWGGWGVDVKSHDLRSICSLVG